jgi:hypothetical protein
MSHPLARHSVPASARTFTFQHAISTHRRLVPLFALALIASWCGPVYAIDVVAVEEHWELTVGEPDASLSGPQVCMVMSPTGDLSSDYFMFTINHRSHPEYTPGGMQVQQWNGDSLVDSREGFSEGALHHNDEVVRWVQRTEINGGSLTFEVRNGESVSWGEFGDEAHLKFTIDTHSVARGVGGQFCRQSRPFVGSYQAAVVRLGRPCL